MNLTLIKTSLTWGQAVDLGGLAQGPHPVYFRDSSCISASLRHRNSSQKLVADFLRRRSSALTAMGSERHPGLGSRLLRALTRSRSTCALMSWALRRVFTPTRRSASDRLSQLGKQASAASGAELLCRASASTSLVSRCLSRDRNADV